MRGRREFLQGMAGAGMLAGMGWFKSAGAAMAPGARLKMGVLSDVHLQEPGDEDTLLKAFAYFRDHGADAVLIAGDIANTGKVEQLKRCADAWYKVFPNDAAPDGRHVEKLFIYGNHDIWGGWWGNNNKFREDSIWYQDRYAKVWEETFHEPYSDFWIKNVKGIPVVGGHWNKTDQFDGLADFLKQHAKEIDPSLPLIYTQHSHPLNTCMGPWAWGRDNGASTKALSAYPNAVAFSGHSHYTLVDERSVWQGAFTSINTSSLRYASNDYSLRENIGWNGHGYLGEKKVRKHRMAEYGSKDTTDGRQGMLVSVWDDHLAIERRDFFQDASLGPDWVVPLPASESAPFAFKVHRQRRTAPEFAKGAKAEVKVELPKDEKDFTHVNVTFPAAQPVDGCRVNEYEVTAVLVEDDVELVQAQRRMMSPDFYKPATKLVKDVTFVFAAEDLPLKGHYRFEVRPLECLGKKGAAIASDVVEI